MHIKAFKEDYIMYLSCKVHNYSTLMAIRFAIIHNKVAYQLHIPVLPLCFYGQVIVLSLVSDACR